MVALVVGVGAGAVDVLGTLGADGTLLTDAADAGAADGADGVGAGVDGIADLSRRRQR